MPRIRINPTAQSLMDGLYRRGYVLQAISNSEWVKGSRRDTQCSFLAEQHPRRGAAKYYEGWGKTLLAAIRNAIKDGPVE